MAELIDLERHNSVDLAKHPSGLIPTIQNIVSSVDLGCKLDLQRIALSARNSEFNAKRFSCVIMRIREPKTTALMFASGKMVCTGAKTEDKSKIAARKFARIVQKIGFKVQFLNFKIQNIVCSCDVRFSIQLETLVFALGQFCTYEPEVFPGLKYRMAKPKIVFLVFTSGKVVITGAKVRQESYDAFENIYPILAEHQRRRFMQKGPRNAMITSSGEEQLE